MTQEELKAAYALSARPYIEADGPIPESVLGLKSWRYLIELNTACNLRCAMCISGNAEGYDRPKGNKVMELPLVEKILDKMHAENPNAIVCPYGNGEPFLNPNLAECIAAIKRRGFRCELATNLHYTDRLDDVLRAKPDFIIVSTSGFTQEVYSKAHIGGNVETLKANIKLLAEARDRVGFTGTIAVSFHMYEYNLHEVGLMEEFTKGLGFLFMLSWARTISLENTVQALRHLDRVSGKEVPDFSIGLDGHDWNKLPPAKIGFIDGMNRLRFHPAKARELYARFPVAPVCVIGDVFTYIRHDGQVQLCAWTDDRRMLLGNYLDLTQEQISEARRNNTFCEECRRYRLNLYYHVADCTRWDSGGVPAQ